MESKPSNYDSQLLVDIRTAADMLGGISERTVWSNSQPRGDIPVKRVGKRVLDPVDGLRRYATRGRQARATDQYRRGEAVRPS